MGYLDGTTGLLLEEEPLYGLAVALIEEAAGQQDEAQRKVCHYTVALLQLEGVDDEQLCYGDGHEGKPAQAHRLPSPNDLGKPFGLASVA